MRESGHPTAKQQLTKKEKSPDQRGRDRQWREAKENAKHHKKREEKKPEGNRRNTTPGNRITSNRRRTPRETPTARG